MSPVEGCPTVFQAICSLSPGMHQYKFFVDGEWRHDERQPTISGEYGIVNTVYLTREINSVLSPSTPGTRMDVDNENFQRTVTLSDGNIQDGTPRVSEAAIQISRCRVSEFLSLHTGYDLLPDSGKVIALDINLPVKQSFHILHEQVLNVTQSVTSSSVSLVAASRSSIISSIFALHSTFINFKSLTCILYCVVTS
jgi:hypothetical protein